MQWEADLWETVWPYPASPILLRAGALSPLESKSENDPMHCWLAAWAKSPILTFSMTQVNIWLIKADFANKYLKDTKYSEMPYTLTFSWTPAILVPPPHPSSYKLLSPHKDEYCCFSQVHSDHFVLLLWVPGIDVLFLNKACTLSFFSENCPQANGTCFDGYIEMDLRFYTQF